jgi:hypothetical protein
MQTDVVVREVADSMLFRQVIETALLIVFQIGISWESVFEILANNIDDIFQSLVESQLNKLVEQFLGKEGLFEILLRTPAPKLRGGSVLFGTPTRPIWSNLKTLYWTRFLPVGYLALFVSVMVSNFGKAWGFGASKQKQRQLGLVIGLFLIPAGWYLAVGYLKLMNLLTLGIAPDLALLQDDTVEAFSMVLTTDLVYAGLIGSTSIIAFLLALILNLLRLMTLWILVPTLPLALGFDLGEFPVLGRFSRRAYTMFVVLGAVPIPMGIGFRILYSFNKMAGQGGAVFYDAIAPTVFIILLPTLAALIPVYVFMQAADYATIRGVTATLSIIGKPASLAVSGGTSAGWSLLKKGVKTHAGGGNSGGGDDGPGGNDDDSGSGGETSGSGGGRSGSGQHSGGADNADDQPALPKRTPSGGDSKNRHSQSTNSPSANGTGASADGSQPPALPPAKKSSGSTANTPASEGATASSGRTPESEQPQDSHADQTMARSNRYSNDVGRTGSGSRDNGAWRKIPYDEVWTDSSPGEVNDTPASSDGFLASSDSDSSNSQSQPESSEPADSNTGAETSADTADSTSSERRVARISRSQHEQGNASARRRRQTRLRERYDGTQGDSE